MLTPSALVYIHTAAHTPTPLLEALASHLNATGMPCSTLHLHLDGPLPHLACSSLRDGSLFIGDAATRAAVARGDADFTPVNLSDAPALLLSSPLDLALVTLSPPDKHGLCSLGASCDVSRAALQRALRIVAVINPRAPRTFGSTAVHVSQLDWIVEDDAPMHSPAPRVPSSAEDAIGRIIAEQLVVDGATLQLGIGGIAAAVASHLHAHKDLGIHTELLGDGIAALWRAGVVTGARKTSHPGLVVATFAVGSPELYSWMDDNPAISLLSADVTNDTALIRRQAAMTSINGAIEVDLTGSICADSVGHRLYSGTGGQGDYMRGAALASGGVPITALSSMTSSGKSRIVAALQPGAGVVTTRASAHYIVTEHGHVDISRANVRERARLLISIAAPQHREALTEAARQRGLA